MVQIISGPKGSGKTKEIINLANGQITEVMGEIVFINDREKYREELDTVIRYVNTEDFYIYTPAELFGFVNGLIAGNYDIERIYIDNLVRVTRIKELNDLEELIQGLEQLENKYSVKFVVSITSAEPLPENFREYAYS